MITAEQLRAARGALRMDQAVLAKRSGVSVETIKRLERGKGPLRAQPETLDAIVDALEDAGIEFLDEEKGKANGVGIRIVGDLRRVFRQQMRTAVQQFADALANLQEQDDPEFTRRGYRYVLEIMVEDFTEELKQNLRDWAKHGDIKEPRRQRRT